MKLSEHDRLRAERQIGEWLAVGLVIVLMLGGIVMLLHCESLSFR